MNGNLSYSFDIFMLSFFFSIQRRRECFSFILIFFPVSVSLHRQFVVCYWQTSALGEEVVTGAGCQGEFGGVEES